LARGKSPKKTTILRKEKWPNETLESMLLTLVGGERNTRKTGKIGVGWQKANNGRLHHKRGKKGGFKNRPIQKQKHIAG